MFPSCAVILTTVLGFRDVLGDPCSDEVYSVLPDIPKRNPAYEMDSIPLCDGNLPKKWYRAGFHEMPRQAPELAYCGTLYPYWMNGENPASGITDYVNVCQVGFEDNCVKSHTIRVKNCGFYTVYELTPLDSCNSAYCFEPTERCVPEVLYGLYVAYHNVSWVSTPTDENANLRQHMPSVNLICKFIPLNHSELYYDITWYVDNTIVLENQTVTADTRLNAILNARQMVRANKKAGSMIHCTVGAKLMPDDYACNTTSSPLFFAGIKLSTTNLEIERGRRSTLHLQFTIPFADAVLVIRRKEQNASSLRISINSMRNGSSDCLEENLFLEGCVLHVPAYKFSERDKYASDEWKKNHSLTIDNSDSGDFSIDKNLSLRLQTGGTFGNATSPSKIFESIILPDVKVHVREPNEVWKGKVCRSITDPNMKTFDNTYYGCQLSGTFILYRNKAYNQEVQEMHDWCHTGATCNCAVAVRSGRDVFTIDICKGHTEIINFPFCEDQVLKVMKAGDREYKVILPTGTIVAIEIRKWSGFQFLNIYITSSPSDVNSTKGLCGILDGNSDNDFTGRDNTQYPTSSSNADVFARTWRVNDSENLLTGSQTVFNGLTSISNNLARVCTCSDTTDPRKSKIKCKYGNYKNCKFNVGKEFHCILNPATLLRRKRDLTYLNSNSVAERVPNREARRNERQAGMSVEEANRTCLMAFERSDPYLTCKQKVTHLSDSSVEGCISDLQITGDANMTSFHIDTALEQCATFITLNSTFQKTEPDTTYKIKTLCPSNCSGKGLCNAGNCTCNPRYAGSDCSFDLLGPPTITHISGFGLCDRSEEDCDEITLYGRYFLENMNSTCFITRKMMAKNGSVTSTDNIERKLEERTLYEGYCPLEYSTNPAWATKFTFNISNDGRNFTENFNVYTYQSLCQEYVNNSGQISITFKDGYCFVDGRCVADGKNNPNNFCDICNVTRNKYRWTFKSGHCLISGRCIADGDFDETRICYHCNPSLNITSWSYNPELCFINNACYFDEEKRDSSDCDICNVTRNPFQWTFNEECTRTTTISATLSSVPVSPPKSNTPTFETSSMASPPTTEQSTTTEPSITAQTLSTSVPTSATHQTSSTLKTTTATQGTTTQPKPILESTAQITRTKPATITEITATVQQSTKETTTESTTTQKTTQSTTVKQTTAQQTTILQSMNTTTKMEQTSTDSITAVQLTTTESKTSDETTEESNFFSKDIIIAITLPSIVIVVIAIGCAFYFCFRRTNVKGNHDRTAEYENKSYGRSWMRHFSNEAKDQNLSRFQIPRAFEDYGNSYSKMKGTQKQF